ncbi:MAG: 50S ribosomal protein L15 [Alphaproteobacteria bacterium]|nr:50S ribosomal protein L15 [Alphaproteobacteria bacterium]
MAKLNALCDNLGSRPGKKRVGRGMGSGKGKTAGRGHKGQKARSGTSGVRTFEGGQTPIYRRLNKIGFFNIFRKNFAEINIGKIEKAIEEKKLVADKVIDVAALQTARLINRAEGGLKVLGEGKLTKALKIEAVKWTKSAEEAIKKAGGSIAAPAKKEPKAKAEKPAAKKVVKKKAVKK